MSVDPCVIAPGRPDPPLSPESLAKPAGGLAEPLADPALKAGELQPPLEVVDHLPPPEDGMPLDQQPPIKEAGRLVLNNSFNDIVI